MAVTTALIGTARALNFVLKDLYDGAKDEVKKRLSRWAYEKNVNHLYKTIYDIRNVKTIWKTDKKVNLMTFYYPSKVIIDNVSTIINNINKLQSTNNIIIEGTVGQGKSIFLRYLCSQELSSGNRVPVFLQLRKIQSGETLKQNIFKVFDALNFDINEELFDYLSKEGKIVLFLDGFDEISEGLVAGIVGEMEHLSQKYPNLKTVVTSRPKSGLENSQYYEVYKLAPLTRNDHRPFLNKLIKDPNIVSEIDNAIIKSDTNILELLKTPLMMTLLIFLYQSEQKIPKQLSEFYENLFPLLFYRHDKSKLGFERKRNCTLNERDMQRVFEAFCYISRKYDKTEFTEKQMMMYSEEAIKINSADCNVIGYVEDITKISCLVIEEGLSYHLIHKSVQEYHAACFILHRPEEFVKSFYERMMSNKYKNWENELRFLSQMDMYRYNKYYLIPDINYMFDCIGVTENNIKQINTSNLELLLKGIRVLTDKETDKFIGYANDNKEMVSRTLSDLIQCIMKSVTETMYSKEDRPSLLKFAETNALEYIVVNNISNVLSDIKIKLDSYKIIKRNALQFLQLEEKNDALLP